jgi:hypothetical protein
LARVALRFPQNTDFMALQFTLQPNEKLIYKGELKKDVYPYPITFAVTNLAVFVTKEKHFARKSWYLERIPLTEIEQVSLVKESKAYIYTVSAVLFLFGLILTIFMVIPNLRQDENAVRSFLPLTIAAIGVALPFLIKTRRVLMIKKTIGVYKWKPQIFTESNLNIWFAKTLAGKTNTSEILRIQEKFLEACEKIGVRISKKEK